LLAIFTNIVIIIFIIVFVIILFGGKIMGTKTIYVKEEDERLFDQAARLGGISSIIAAALREYLAKHSDSKETDDRTKLVIIQKDIDIIKKELEIISAKLGAEQEEEKLKGKRG
jgi:hypothetical protein